jgi:hypothetical protein
MRALLLTILFAVLTATAAHKATLQPDNCNLVIVNGDEPGVVVYTVGRVCTLPTKAEWAKAQGLDTTVTDTTKISK